MSKPVKFRTAGGQIVTWSPRDSGDDWGSWLCEGCEDTGNGHRKRADEHALDCRAIA